MKTFEDIVRGERSVQRIHEDEHHIAFLNPSPTRPGHTIVIPRKLSGYIFDVERDEYHALWEFARIVARRIREKLPCERVCVGVVGWQVRHVHVHLVPTNADGEFPPLPGVPMDERELARIVRLLS